MPTDETRATLTVTQSNKPQAIIGHYSDIQISNVVADGNRRNLGAPFNVWVPELIEIGGSEPDGHGVSGQVVDHIIAYDPIGWSVLHLFLRPKKLGIQDCASLAKTSKAHVLARLSLKNERTSCYTLSMRLPFESTIRAGIHELRGDHPRPTIPALLASIGAPRLRTFGFAIRHPFRNPEHRLYRKLNQKRAGNSHSAYNSLIRRLVSFERAASCAKRRT